MNSISTDVPSANRPTARSLEAYVLPHVVDVMTHVLGTVTALFVGDYEIVVQGQPLAQVERRWERPSDRRDDEFACVVRAPTSGLVSRCWANVGEAIWPKRPLFSIASSESVLVVARFAHAAASRLRIEAPASIFIGGNTLHPLAGKIVSIVEQPDGGPWDDAVVDDGAVRVILRLDSAPAGALWPGTPAQVEV